MPHDTESETKKTDIKETTIAAGEIGERTSHVDAAGGHLLEPDNRPAGVIVEGEDGGTIDEDAVVIGGPAADLPPEAAVDLDEEVDESVGLVLGEGVAEVRGDGDEGAGEVRRPDVDVLVALVDAREAVGGGDLLVLVGGVDVEAVVVDADAVVRVSGGDGDLEGGGEEIRGGEVEGENPGVLQVELGFGGAEDEPDDEDREEDEDDEEGDAEDGSPDYAAALAVSVVAALLHRRRRRSPTRCGRRGGAGLVAGLAEEGIGGGGGGELREEEERSVWTVEQRSWSQIVGKVRPFVMLLRALG